MDKRTRGKHITCNLRMLLCIVWYYVYGIYMYCCGKHELSMIRVRKYENHDRFHEIMLYMYIFEHVARNNMIEIVVIAFW